jgi:very-short-patch-repair endonuclease
MLTKIAIGSAIRTVLRSHGADAALAALAARQHGVVGRLQLLAVGLGASWIRRRVAAARLHVVYPGVYAVGHRKLSREGCWMAAVLAGGEDGVLVDVSAAALHGFADLERHVIHVNSDGRRGPKGVRMHRAKLPRYEVMRKQGIPVTTPARTLFDLATSVNDQQLERALREALFHSHTSLPALRRTLEAHRGERGAGALRRAIERAADAPGRLRSRKEQRFADWLRTHRLPMPEFNVYMRVADLELEADCYWRDQRLVAEIDDRSTHARRQDFERDRIRDRTLQAHGLRAIRVVEPYDGDLSADLTRLLVAAAHEGRNQRTT